MQNGRAVDVRQRLLMLNHVHHWAVGATGATCAHICNRWLIPELELYIIVH